MPHSEHFLSETHSIGRSGLDTCEGFLQRTGKRPLQLPSDYAPLPVTPPKSSGYLHGTPGQPCKGSRGPWLRSRSHPCGWTDASGTAPTMPERTPDARAAKKEIVQPKRQKGAAKLTSTGRRIRGRCPAQAGERRAKHAEPRRDIDRQGEP